MADTLTLDAAPRSAAGKGNKRLRREGTVPVHVFGNGIQSQPMQAEERALRHVIHQAGTTGLITLQVEGKPENVMVRKVQRHPVTGRLIHVDLYQVNMRVKTQVRVPLVFVGDAPGVSLHDGVLVHLMEGVQVEALPGDIPHNMEVDVSVLAELDQALHVRDIKMPASLRVLDDPDEIVIKVQPTRAAEAAAGAEAGAPAAEGGEAQPAAEGAAGE